MGVFNDKFTTGGEGDGDLVHLGDGELSFLIIFELGLFQLLVKAEIPLELTRKLPSADNSP